MSEEKKAYYIAGFGDSDMDNERHLVVHFFSDWSDVLWNGEPAGGALLMADRKWKRYGFGELPDETAIQTSMASGKPAWRAKPNPLRPDHQR